MALRASIASRTPATLWLPDLSAMTICPGCQPDHDPVHLAQPLAVFCQRRVRRPGKPVLQLSVQVHQPASRTRFLRPRCNRSRTRTVLPSLDHTGDADLEPSRRLPVAHESHQPVLQQDQNAILPSTELL